MNTINTQAAAESISDRFLQMITPRRRNPDRAPVEDQDYLEMLWRMIRALEARAANNPEIIIQMIALDQRLAEACNVAIAISAERYQVDPKLGASAGEIARLLGITKQSISERRARGRAVMAERIDAAGATRFSEAAREKAAIVKAQDHAVTSLAEYRARHAKVA